MNDTCVFGKSLQFLQFTVVHLLDYQNIADKDYFMAPPVLLTNPTRGMGFTVRSSILIIDNTKAIKGVACTWLLEPRCEMPRQDKVEVLAGWSDFIVHGGKLYAVSTDSYMPKEFTGFKLVNLGHGLVKSPTDKVKHSIANFTFGLYALNLPIGIDVSEVTVTHVRDINPPISINKFGVTGGTMAYTWAKLAASELNPGVFYIQLGYEYIMQLGYEDGKFLYYETAAGKLYRTDPTYKAKVDAKTIETDYPVNILNGMHLGGIYRIQGQYYLESSVTNSSLTLFECLGDSQCAVDPTTNRWQCWLPVAKPDIYDTMLWAIERSNPYMVLLYYHALANTALTKQYGLGATTV